MKHEHISALMDDELTADERRHCIDALSSDQQLKRAWGRYHLIGEMLRAQHAASRHTAAASRAAPPSSPVAASRGRWRVPMSGLALAAAVAALTITLVTRQPSTDPQPAFELAARDAPTPNTAAAPDAVAAVPSGAIEAAMPAADYDQRLNGYLVNFNEQRARLGVPGVHPYVRIVGFESR